MIVMAEQNGQERKHACGIAAPTCLCMVSRLAIRKHKRTPGRFQALIAHSQRLIIQSPNQLAVGLRAPNPLRQLTNTEPRSSLYSSCSSFRSNRVLPTPLKSGVAAGQQQQGQQQGQQYRGKLHKQKAEAWSSTRCTQNNESGFSQPMDCIAGSVDEL